MKPTVSPWAWVSSWDRRARTRAAGDYAHSRDRAAQRARDHDKYSYYGISKDSRHFIRLDPLAKGLLLNRKWVPTTAPVTWRIDYFPEPDPWAEIKSIQSYRPYVPPGDAAPPPATPAGAHGWTSAARGWACGTVALALLVLLVRAAENCLHKRLFRSIYAHTNVGAGQLQQNQMRPGHYRLQGVRRQESDEWSTPNVTATSLQLQHRDFDAGSVTRLEDIEGLAELGQHNNDMPPPYSECARSSIQSIDKFVGEELPPPYSDCSVSFTNAKDEEPEVHIRQHPARHERAHSSTDIDNVQNDLIENGLRAEAVATNGNIEPEDVTPGVKTELVFDNGRVVERRNLDLNSNNSETEGAGNANVLEQTPRDVACNDRVVYVDETAPDNTPPGGALPA